MREWGQPTTFDKADFLSMEKVLSFKEAMSSDAM